MSNQYFFSIFTGLCHHHHSVIYNIFVPSKEPISSHSLYSYSVHICILLLNADHNEVSCCNSSYESFSFLEEEVLCKLRLCGDGANSRAGAGAGAGGSRSQGRGGRRLGSRGLPPSCPLSRERRHAVGLVSHSGCPRVMSGKI